MDTSSFFNYPTLGGPAPARGEPQWDAVLAHAQTRRFRRSEIVIAAGEADRSLYVLTDGRLEVVEGSPRAPIAAPAVVGEAAFFDGRPRAVGLRALTDGEILRLGYDAFEALAARDPLVARAFLIDLGRILSERLRAAGEHAEWTG